MHPENKLFRRVETALEVEPGLPIIASLTGFTDAGGCVNQFSEHIFANLEANLIASFDNDSLLDYRSRRPNMYFEKDHISSYEPATLGLYLVVDEVGQRFLFLDGYEPDFAWERFTDAVIELIAEFEVTSFNWVHSIPFPIPHTREIGVTVSGNRTELIDKYSEWKPQTQVPGNVLHLLEFKLVEQQLPAAGFVLLVPHYLADSDMPQVALQAIELISFATGLVFPSDQLRERGGRFLAKLAKQVEENGELQKMIATLEQGYQNSSVGPARAPINQKRSAIPSADEIAAELEGYLAQHRRSGEGTDEEL